MAETQAQRDVMAAMDRLSRLLHDRDPAFVDEFADRDDVLLVGSEEGEIARGREAIAALLRKLYARPVRLAWAFGPREVTVAGDIAWVFADCEIVMQAPDSETHTPYRLSGVLERIEGRWRWRFFHGAEPA